MRSCAPLHLVDTGSVQPELPAGGEPASAGRIVQLLVLGAPVLTLTLNDRIPDLPQLLHSRPRPRFRIQR